jgi:SAM-dependent methyltransferase
VKNRIPNLFSRSLRRGLRRAYYWPIDSLTKVLGKRDEFTPPKGLWPGYVISGGFEEHGSGFLEQVIKLTKLAPEGVVLDLGCGIGRIAVPLTKYLNASGLYEGLDIDPEAIAWCQRTLSKKHPNFHFRLIDVHNARYNPSGQISASEYRFPYQNGSFDLAIVKSVFTHMLPTDVENYVGEIARTLKDTAACLVTFFLLNPQSLTLIKSGRAKKKFPAECGVYRLENPEEPEALVAYDEAYIRTLYSRAGLEIVEPIHYGSWLGHREALFAQDIIVAAKKSKPGQ